MNRTCIAVAWASLFAGTALSAEHDTVEFLNSGKLYPA